MKYSILSTLSSLLAGRLCYQIDGATPRGDLTVKTLTGVYTGQVQSEYSNVREFRYIPYAQPPVGPRRWVPPVALTPNSRHTYSYRFGPICPQYLGRNNSVWNSNITDFSVDIGGQSSTAGAAAQTASEDCLSLAIWTPLNASLEDRLPVTLFIPGGSFVTGGITVPYQQPAPMVSRRNEMIGITVNYRVNIMGFPNSAALEDQNLGILDLRMALEWVYANIANFGGDPERIVLWGQSAGGVAADMLGFAYHDNPLVKGYFLQSGTAAVKTIPADPTYSNFTFVARSLGCDFPDNKEAELACMKQLPVSQMTNFVGQFRENNTDPGFNFQPVPDDKVVFNYSARAEAGLIPKGPALISTTANEASSLTKYPSNVTAGPDQTAVEQQTVDVFVCLAANATDWRVRNKVTTYRYQYAGNFSSLTPLPWMGAYHAADIPMIMGTYRRRPDYTDHERAVAETMQDYVFAFIVDPENGLRDKGWAPQDERVLRGGDMVRFASMKGGEVAQNISSLVVDGACVLGASYDSSP